MTVAAELAVDTAWAATGHAVACAQFDCSGRLLVTAAGAAPVAEVASTDGEPNVGEAELVSPTSAS